MKNTTTYKIQFFHGGEGVWKGAGLRTFTDLNEARKSLRAQCEMCDRMVSFRIVDEPTGFIIPREVA